jgi:hypothetical protein
LKWGFKTNSTFFRGIMLLHVCGSGKTVGSWTPPLEKLHVAPDIAKSSAIMDGSYHSVWKLKDVLERPFSMICRNCSNECPLGPHDTSSGVYLALRAAGAARIVGILGKKKGEKNILINRVCKSVAIRRGAADLNIAHNTSVAARESSR